MSTVIETRGITKVYQMGEFEVHALRGVDLTVESGTSTARITDSVRESVVGDRVEVVR